MRHGLPPARILNSDVTARAKDPKFPLECPTPLLCRSSFEGMRQIVSIDGTGVQAGKCCSWGTGNPSSLLRCLARCSVLSQTAGHAGASFMRSMTAVILFSPFQFPFSGLHLAGCGARSCAAIAIDDLALRLTPACPRKLSSLHRKPK